MQQDLRFWLQLSPPCWTTLTLQSPFRILYTCGIVRDHGILHGMPIPDWDSFLRQLASRKLSHSELSSLLE